MKSARITFRLSPYQLARGLQIVRHLEPNYELISINDLVKTIYHDYIAKMNLNQSDDIPYDFIEEVNSVMTRPSTKKTITIEDLMTLKAPAAEPSAAEPPEPINEPEPIEQPTEELLESPDTQQNKASDFDDPNITDSEISAVTDFSPPKNWMD